MRTRVSLYTSAELYCIRGTKKLQTTLEICESLMDQGDMDNFIRRSPHRVAAVLRLLFEQRELWKIHVILGLIATFDQSPSTTTPSSPWTAFKTTNLACTILDIILKADWHGASPSQLRYMDPLCLEVCNKTDFWKKRCNPITVASLKIDTLTMGMISVERCAQDFPPDEVGELYFREYLSQCYRLLHHLWERRDVLLNFPHSKQALAGNIDSQIAISILPFVTIYTRHLRETRFAWISNTYHNTLTMLKQWGCIPTRTTLFSWNGHYSCLGTSYTLADRCFPLRSQLSNVLPGYPT